MSEMESQFRLAALAALPPGHPDRAQFQTELAALPPAQREYWLRIAHESELLHQALASSPATPESLTQKLLALPDHLPVASKSSRRLLLTAAACLILLVPVAIYFYVNREPDYPAYTNNPPLAAQTATDIATIAIKIHQSPPALTVTSSDPAVVTAALKDNKMPFPTILLKPTQPVTLIGGGICDFGPTRAIFTRWQSAAKPTITYTLYQLDGAPFNVPANFQRQLAAPADPTQPARVSLWPGFGNPCTWALVLDSPQSPSPFYY